MEQKKKKESDRKDICGLDKIISSQPEKKAELSKYLESLPLTDDIVKNKGFLIQSLHKAQEIFGYLPESVQLFVAKALKLHLSEVYGVISFYSFFTDLPQGDFKINVCTGTACFVRGAADIMAEFTRYLNINEGETSKDGRFSLGGVRCVGTCSLAPVVMVNDKIYGNVTKKMVPEIIENCK